MALEFSIEALDKALDYPTIKVESSSLPKGNFDRIRLFTALGESYRIEWWMNTCYLIHGNLQIPFVSVRQSNTWPNNSKMNLQFYDRGIEVCCVVKIDLGGT